MTAGNESRVEQGRRDASRRWDAYRAERIAAGLPSTKTAESGRQSPFLHDPEVEATWIDECRRLGLDPGTTRTALRKAAKLLADAAAFETARQATGVDEGHTVPPLGDEDVLIAFYEREVKRWRKRAKRDARMARVHEEYAAEAEFRLADLLAQRRKAKS